MKIGTCKLCQEEKPLQNSHIVPASIYKWLKKTSGTGRIRTIKNLNKPIQDGQKRYMLCRDCEQRFSKNEKKFKERIFLPVNNPQVSTGFEYDQELYYFVLSVWWRTIQLSISEDEEIKECKYLPVILECEKELRLFLHEGVFPPNFNKVFLALTGLVESAPKEYKMINYYFLRAVDPFIMFDDESCFFALKIPSFWFFGNIVGLDTKSLKPTEINPLGGTYSSEGIILSEPHIASFLHERLSLHNDLHEKMSPVQTRKVTEAHIKNLDRFLSSKSYEAWISDRLRENE